MKVPLSWMQEFVSLPGDAQAVAHRLSLCGFEVASVEGEVIDFEITANRPDCLSVYGLAREAAAAYSLGLKPYAADSAFLGPVRVPVSIGDAGCGRYALAVADVTVGPSPAWLAARLTAAGVRPINNVVDVTNYVMLECGHPLHAFDLAKLGGPEIRVRRARPNEALTTLDGVKRVLDETMLVIADKERAVAIAGVMGGAASEVSGATTRVAIESAWFLPASVRATSRRLGLKTEASARFERGADLTAPVRALERTLQLLTSIEAGQPAGSVADVYPRAFEPRTVALSSAHVDRLLGDRVAGADVERILGSLGFTLTSAGTGWKVGVPAFRVDVTREADLIEEVGRHWGFDRIPASFPALGEAPRPASPDVVRDRRLRRVLCGAGLQEACTFTFLEREAAAPFAPPGLDAVAIANPLSEKFAVLRPSLLPGLLEALAYSRRRAAEDIRLFETGAVFFPGGEAVRVAWVLCGSESTHWSRSATGVDFFDAKGVAELVGSAFGLPVAARTPTAPTPWLVRGRAAELVADLGRGPEVVGTVGQIAPALVEARGLAPGTEVVAGELDHARLAAHASADLHAIEPLPRFPSIVRDLSIVVDARLPAADVRGTIRTNAPSTLVSISEFDRYQGKGVPEGRVSLSLRLTFRHHDRTLTDAEVQDAVAVIVSALEVAHDATLRGKSE